MSARVAWLFPGHGSQYPGMGREVLQVSAAAREVFEAAEDLSELPLRKVMLSGPAERLGRPAMLEPALAALSLAHAAWLADYGLAPDSVAGYSAGEVAALYAAGVLCRVDALRLAVLRGRVLERAAAGPAVRTVALCCVPSRQVADLVRSLESRGPIAIAGWNAEDHTTITGMAEIVCDAERSARALGAVASAVEVGGAWHSPMLAEAAAEVLDWSRDVEFRPPCVPLYAGASGRRESDPDRIRLCVARQICQPVRWRQVLDSLLRNGCTRFLELGPGGVLTSFLRRRRRGDLALDVQCVERRGGALGALDRLGGAARKRAGARVSWQPHRRQSTVTPHG
ncbi:MAG TPA: ACP S-malonyltransferase [Gemmatimonadales bacterium]